MMNDRWCMTPKGSLAGSKQRVERFRSGILNLGFGAVDVSDGIDWHADPFETRMWGFRLHNLQWLYDFYRVASESGEHAVAHDANSVIEDWIQHNNRPESAPEIVWDRHVTALRARVLLCSVMVFGGPFREVLGEHAHRIAEEALVEPAWNHGTDQLLTLLSIGCALQDRELIRMSTERLGQTLSVIIDEQGVTNEQSPTYDFYVWTQLEELAQLVEDCGLEEIPLLNRRFETPRFLAHATRPDGLWAHLGDTIPTRVHSIEGTPLEYALSSGSAGYPPDDRIAIFDRGYAFGRSGWGSQRSLAEESWYSIRFGPGRRIHGHRDHTSVTWYAFGRPMLVDSGFSGYDDGRFREYERSEFGHSQVVVRGAGDFNPDASTDLVNHRRGDGWESYSLQDRPYESVVRRRHVYVGHEPPLMILRDDLRSRSRANCRFTSLLHLPTDTSNVETLPSGYIVHLPADEPITLQVTVSGATEFEVFRAWSGTGGWIGQGLLDRQPAPVLASSATGKRVSMTSVLLPTTEHDPHVTIESNRVSIYTVAGSEIVRSGKRNGLSRWAR